MRWRKVCTKTQQYTNHFQSRDRMDERRGQKGSECMELDAKYKIVIWVGSQDGTCAEHEKSKTGKFLLIQCCESFRENQTDIIKRVGGASRSGIETLQNYAKNASLEKEPRNHQDRRSFESKQPRPMEPRKYQPTKGEHEQSTKHRMTSRKKEFTSPYLKVQ